MDALTHSALTQWLSPFWFWTLKSDPKLLAKDLSPLRHFKFFDDVDNFDIFFSFLKSLSNFDIFYNIEIFDIFNNFDILTIMTYFSHFDNFYHFRNFLKFDIFLHISIRWRYRRCWQFVPISYFNNCKDNPGDLWHLRHWLKLILHFKVQLFCPRSLLLWAL